MGDIEKLLAEATPDQLAAALIEARKALSDVISACDNARMIPKPGHGVGGMTIEANIRGSVYNGVDAWPVEEARAALARLREARRK